MPATCISCAAEYGQPHLPWCEFGLPQRIASKLRGVDDHWVWMGWVNSQGYPYVRHENRDQPAYRVVWRLLVGEIPRETPELDHLCGIIRCCNPAHLEPVTNSENMRRLSLRQMSCRRMGHDWTDPRNVYIRKSGGRFCRECERQRRRNRYRAARAAGATRTEASKAYRPSGDRPALRALAAAALTAVLLTLAALTAPAAAADPYRWTLYGDVAAQRPCTSAERTALGTYPSEPCTVVPRLDQGSFDEGDPAWCWPDEDSPAWVQRTRKEMC